MRTEEGSEAAAVATSDAGGAQAFRQPELTVIIPVRDDATRLRKCLRALQEQTLPPTTFEVIVVDNDSAEPVTLDDCDPLDVRLLRETRPGSYAARNLGIAHAHGRMLAFTDSDCVPAPDWLEKGREALLANRHAGVVGGRITLFEETETDTPPDPTAVAFERLFGYAKFDQERFVAAGHCITANWISWATTIREHDGFDGGLKSRGDFELSERLTLAGRPIVYAPEVVVAHPIREHRGEIIAKQCRVIGGRWQAAQGSNRVWRLWRMILRNNWRRLVRVVRASDLPVGTRLALTAFILRMWWVCTFEVVRLELGGSPQSI